ncbi:triose-phosphate isomerase [Litoribrevibacter albus]|uniref:Triosephosphate isomerase n=1 Tax=Litoribrevibacter albus TaxID=1473156 RepID=A0AA37S7K1_9GAMM|nr:triose-phosphate isomerase [Litoribrevibacter albus]GLQ29693.1 triosephosphate isomerase [Litoribrevibacter albus]
MRKSIVAGNWKLNGSLETVSQLASGVASQVSNLNSEVVVCPVYVHLNPVASAVSGKKVALGAQNCSAQLSGAYTGEVSPGMLKELGCEYVILGHSERRSLFSETDSDVSEKMKSVLEQGLVPILCVGETLEEREQGLAELVVKTQLLAAVEGLSSDAVQTIVVAYEPVWAIGTGLTATPEQAQQMHSFIRGVLATVSQSVAEQVRILYGGSVKPDNAQELFAQDDIDGGLIGGASLNVEDFVAICKAAG